MINRAILIYGEKMTKRNTISTTYLKNINELENEFNWNEFSIQTPTDTIDYNNFELIAIGTPNQEKESWNIDIKSDKYDIIIETFFNYNIIKFI